MGNCFVTKLKGVVTDDNLMKLNHFRVKVIEAGGGMTLELPAGIAGTIKSVNNGSIDVSYVAQGAAMITVANTIVDISNKYDLLLFGCNHVDADVEVLRYSPLTLVSVIEGNLHGDIADLFYSATDLQGVNVRNNSLLTGDVACLSGKITNASRAFNFSYTNVYGDAAVFLEINSGISLEVNIMGTRVTTTQATIDALAAKNITLVYNKGQVVPAQ